MAEPDPLIELTADIHQIYEASIVWSGWRRQPNPERVQEGRIVVAVILTSRSSPASEIIPDANRIHIVTSRCSVCPGRLTARAGPTMADPPLTREQGRPSGGGYPAASAKLARASASATRSSSGRSTPGVRRLHDELEADDG